MPKKISSPFSESPVYQSWLASILIMCLPPLIVILIGDFSAASDPTARLVVFCGFFVVLINRFHLFQMLFNSVDTNIAVAISIVLVSTLIAMWFLILALPVFNQSSKRRYPHIQIIQFCYSVVQAAAGYYLLVFENL